MGWSRPDRRRGTRPASFLIVIVACAAGFTAGCAPRRQRLPPGVMAVMETEQTASFVRNFNPLLEAGAVRWPTRRAMYEPMLVYNPLAGDYVPWLATGYRWSDDRRHLRFELRPGVRWSDGAPLVAEDVLYTFELLRKHPALDGRGLWQELEAVTSPGPLVVEVALKRPHVPSLEAIAQQAIVPAHVWRKVADPVVFANENPVATGPFTVIDFFEAQAYQVGRNPRYWQPGQPAVQALRFRAYPANEQIILALLNDELDWAGTFLPAIERVFEGKNGARAHHRHWFPLLDATVFLYANTKRPPLDDVRVRKALSMGIDRRRIAEVAMHGYTRPADATGLSDAYARYRDPAAVAAGRWVDHDPQAAGRLLDQAGWRLDRDGQGVRRGPDGRPLTLTLELPAGFSDWIAAGQIAVRGLRRLGVDVGLRGVEYQAWFERLQKGDYDLSMAWSDLSTTPHGLYRGLMSTETVRPLGELAAENWHRFGLPEADRLLTALEGSIDRQQSWELVSRLQHLFVEHAPAIPLFPGPLWGEFNSTRFDGFPDAQNPYAPLSPYVDDPQPLLVLTRVRPR